MGIRARLAIAAVVLVGIGFGVTVPAAALSSSAQKKFIAAIHHAAPATNKVSNKKLLALGGAICNILKIGTVANDVALLKEPSNSYHFPKGQVTAIVATSVTYICPSHTKAVQAFEHPSNTHPATAAPPPTTAPPTTAPPTTAPPGPHLTQQQQSAREAALQYLQTSPFSQQGLIDQLDSSAGDGYSVADATAAVDSLTNVNWNNEAVQAAKQYLQTGPFSCTDLIQQLDSSAGDEYTPAQATYGATQAGDCSGGVPTGTTGSSGSTGSTP
jgi:hypothetical protein